MGCFEKHKYRHACRLQRLAISLSFISALLLVGCSSDKQTQGPARSENVASETMATHMEKMEAIKNRIPEDWRSQPLPPWVESPEELQAGAKLFGEHCSPCHGPKGRGEGLLAKQLALTPVNFVDGHHADFFAAGEKFWIVTNGITGSAMPAFGKKLSDEERWQLVAFVLSLRIEGPDEGNE